MRARCRFAVAVFVSSLFLASSLDAATATREFRETVPFASGNELQVENVNGRVSVSSWDREEVEIYAEITVKASSKRRAEDFMDEVEIRIDKFSRGLRVEPDYPRPGGGGFWSWIFGRRPPQVEVNFWIKVPRRSDLELRTVNGTVSVEDVDGRFRLKTTNGRILAERIEGSLDASTVNGRIRVEFDRVDPEGDVSLKAVNGSVRIYLPEDVQADVRASAVNGSVETDFPLERTGKYARKSLRGSLNGGGAAIEIETVNGSIDILMK